MVRSRQPRRRRPPTPSGTSPTRHRRLSKIPPRLGADQQGSQALPCSCQSARGQISVSPCTSLLIYLLHVRHPESALCPAERFADLYDHRSRFLALPLAPWPFKAETAGPVNHCLDAIGERSDAIEEQTQPTPPARQQAPRTADMIANFRGFPGRPSHALAGSPALVPCVELCDRREHSYSYLWHVDLMIKKTPPRCARLFVACVALLALRGACSDRGGCAGNVIARESAIRSSRVWIS